MDIEQLLQSPVAGGLLAATRAGVDWNGLAAASARLFPEQQIWAFFESAVADLSISLCLHHVSRRSRDELTISASELDAFVDRASRIDHRGGRPWLTVSFDDGYEDAWHYVMTRARRFRSVEWLLFVCPTKAEKQSGFRWDLEIDDDVSPRDLELENQRPDLRSIVRLSDSHLATVEQCRLLQLHDNAHLGNHTNCHFRSTSLPPEQAAAELLQSHADFQRIFGEERHFAFPFGGYGVDFDESHVEVLRRASDALIWSTIGRPHHSSHRTPGAVLPRFAVDGRWSASQIAFWIALRSLHARTRGLAPLCPAPPVKTARDEENVVYFKKGVSSAICG
jgi:peptidoglycan/xylan/chitin deacetylase (PgdA/CDA1 family)